MTTAARSNTGKSNSAANAFIGSLAVLIVALAAFAVVFLRGSNDAPVNPATPKAADAHEKRVRLARDAAGEPSSIVASEPSAPTSAPAQPQAEGFQASPDEVPVDPDVQKAIALVDSGQVQDAIAALEAIIKKDPRNEQALTELAMIHLLDLKQSDQAIGYLQRVVDINPVNQVVISELVSLYEEERRTDEGLSYLMEQAARHPESTDIAYGVGQMLVGQGRDSDAIPYLEKAVLSPTADLHAFHDLAEVYSRNGEPERAVDAYSKAISFQANDIKEKAARGQPTAYAEERLNYTKMDKARELIRVGDFEQAQTLLDDVHRAMPDDEALANLQESLYRRRAG